MTFAEGSESHSQSWFTQIYDHEEPRHFQPSRLSVSAYFCRCEHHEEFLPWQPLDDDDKAWLAIWRCNGHPVLLSPSTTFDGLQIEKDTIGPITEKALLGWTPEGTNAEEQPRMRWMGRLYYRMANTEIADDILRLAYERACDADVLTRARAVHFLGATRVLIGSWLAMELLREKRHLFANIPDAHTQYSVDKTLEHTLWRIVDLLVPTPYGAYPRDEALTGRAANAALYQTLARYDSEWFVEHVGEMAGNSPDPDALRGTAFDWLPHDLRDAARRSIDQALEPH